MGGQSFPDHMDESIVLYFFPFGNSTHNLVGGDAARVAPTIYDLWEVPAAHGRGDVPRGCPEKLMLAVYF
jgi:hypothetical protein